jgi:hypothetical protein
VVAAGATKLAVTAISPATPTATQAFSVTVQAQNAGNTPTNVTAATAFTLSNSGGGTIGGTITGTIPAGQNTFTVSGVTLSAAGTGVTITATRTSGDNLTAGTSAPFNVSAAPPPFSAFTEPFSGTGNLSGSNGWATHSGTANQIQYRTTASDAGNSLSNPNLASSAGNRVAITRTGSEDVNRAFSGAITSGAAYYSVLVKAIDTVGIGSEYFLHFVENSGASASGFFARLHVRRGSANNTVNFGILNNSGGTATPTFNTTNLPVGQTHFLVVKHDLGTNTSSLWVNPTTNFGGSEPGGATTNNSGTNNETRAAGIAIRQGGTSSSGTGNLEIDEIRVGTTWASVTPAAAPATQLFFATVPTAGTATVPLSRVTVQARRADNSVATNFTGSVTLTRGGSGTGTLGGTVTRNAVAGIVNFDSLTFSAAGTYTLIASATGLTNATSANITILARASQLAFVNAPTSGRAGAFLPVFRVEARRPDGTVDTSFRAPITIGFRAPSVASDEMSLSSVNSLSGVLTKNAVAGVATFDSVRVDVSGSFVLTASTTISGITAGSSAPVPVTFAATRLALVGVVASGRQNIALPAFTVEARVASGAVDTTFTGGITLALIGTGTLQGTNPRNAVRGVARFDDIRILEAGNFRLVATATGLANDTSGTVGVLNVRRDELSGVPTVFELQQNYPNPFNPSTVIRYGLPSAEQVSLKVYDMLGRQVATLVNARQAAGRYEATFNAAGLSSGIYIYRLQAGSFSQTSKMMLVK